MNLPTWSIIPTDVERQREFAAALGVHPITAQILVNRGIADVAKARDYLSPALQSLPDPYMLPDMDVACERIVGAITRGERIAVFGDYDVDGVTSTALMVRFFSMIGIEVDVHIPHRINEGYGLNVDALKRLKERGVDLVITVDNGTRSASEIELARDIGLDVIITDHHEVGDEMPPAIAVVNPKRHDSNFPDRGLAGCGVAFMLLMALRKMLRDRGMLSQPEPNLREYLDLVAIGTIADIVPLVGVNRILTKIGLAEITSSRKPGVQALRTVCGLADTQDTVRAGHVAFRIAPRLNAAGRLGDAMAALECLITDDEGRAAELAQLLDRTNAERQAVEERILGEAKEQAMEAIENPARHAVVVDSSRWHAGVVGIVASRLSRMSNKPSAVIACENGIGKGSVRTARGIDVVTALEKTAHLLDRFGGHTQAAGFTIDVRRIDEFRASFDAACQEAAKNAVSAMNIDAEMQAAAIDNQLVDEIACLEPYGAGNPEPVLCTSDLTIVDGDVVGTNHLRLRLTDGKARFSAIGFDMAECLDMIHDEPLVAFVPQYNTWNGQTSIQLKIKAILPKNNAVRQ